MSAAEANAQIERGEVTSFEVIARSVEALGGATQEKHASDH